MVFESEGVFQQFVHAGFKETIVRLLPLDLQFQGGVTCFLSVTKQGKVGIHHHTHFGLIHTFLLDLALHPIKIPSCQSYHFVVDAVHAKDINCVVFATTNSILQCYDLGTLEKEDLGLEIFPRSSFLGMKKGQSPVAKGVGSPLIETFRLEGLPPSTSCVTFAPSLDDPKANAKLLIGDTSGGITILEIPNPKYPFGEGKRKIRDVVATIKFSDIGENVKRYYQGHGEAIKEIIYLSQKTMIISSSRDQKFSIFCEDSTQIRDSFWVSFPKGANCVVACDKMGLLATGSADGIVRIFSQFQLRSPQAEMQGHSAAIVALEVAPIPFAEEEETILSYSEDVELRAWNPRTHVCLQRIYLRFPEPRLSARIIRKRPEFGKRSLLFCPGTTKASTSTNICPGFIVILYGNSYAKLDLDRDDSHWPYDFDVKPDRKTSSIRGFNKDPKQVNLTPKEEQLAEGQAFQKMKELMALRGGGTRKGSNFTSLATATLRSLVVDETLLPLERSVVTKFDKLPLYEVPDRLVTSIKEPEYYLK